MMIREVGHHDVGVHPRPGGRGREGIHTQELCHLVVEEQCRHFIKVTRSSSGSVDVVAVLTFFIVVPFRSFIRRYFSTRFFHIFPRFPDKNFRFPIRFEPLVNWISRV
jgi:hypothetical protein